MDGSSLIISPFGWARHVTAPDFVWKRTAADGREVTGGVLREEAESGTSVSVAESGGWGGRSGALPLTMG